MKKSSSFVVTASLLFAGMISSPVSAATYIVNSTLSSVQFSFVFGNTTLAPQGTGADVAFYGGTVEASVPLGGGLLTLDSTAGFGDSLIIGLANSAGPFLPAVGGAVPAGDDEIFEDGSVDTSGDDLGDGLFTAGDDIYGLDLFGSAFATVRNLVLTVEGSGTTDQAATGVGWNFAGGWTSIDAFGGFSESDATQDADDPETLNGGGVIGYSLSGTTETITLPVDVNLADGNNTFILTGQIVASRTIPEPTSGLFLSGLVAAGAFVRRRRK